MVLFQSWLSGGSKAQSVFDSAEKTGPFLFQSALGGMVLISGNGFSVSSLGNVEVYSLGWCILYGLVYPLWVCVPFFGLCILSRLMYPFWSSLSTLVWCIHSGILYPLLDCVSSLGWSIISGLVFPLWCGVSSLEICILFWIVYPLNDGISSWTGVSSLGWCILPGLAHSLSENCSISEVRYSNCSGVSSLVRGMVVAEFGKSQTW